MIQADAFAFKVDMKDDIVFNAGTVEALPVFWDGILVHQILVHDAGNGLATRFMTGTYRKADKLEWQPGMCSFSPFEH